MTDAIVLSKQREQLQVALRAYASALSELTDEQVPAAFDMNKELGKLAEDLENVLRERVLRLVEERGQKVTDKGSMRASIGGFRVTAIPTRTGVDPAKLEGLLRRKNLDPNVHMRTTIKYAIDPEKLEKLQLSDGDLDACKYTPSFRLEVSRE